MPTHHGTAGDDAIDLRAETSGYTIYGYDGRDRILGARYDDLIYGGDDRDTLHGMGGDDRLVGGGGNDEMLGWSGEDLLLGEDGDDIMYGDEGDDSLIGGLGNDRMVGGADDDWLWGEGGDDFLWGESGDDRLYAGAGSDYLDGGDGADRLFAGSGDDHVYGGRGADLLLGGSGADRFFFLPEDLVTATVRIGPITLSHETYETDTIADFDGAAGDRLDLRLILSDKTGFAGGGAAAAVSQGYIYWVQHGQTGQPGFGTTVYLDRTGGPIDSLNAPDLAIVDLQGVAANQLNAGHFIV